MLHESGFNTINFYGKIKSKPAKSDDIVERPLNALTTNDKGLRYSNSK